jgi:hypothetical protein
MRPLLPAKRNLTWGSGLMSLVRTVHQTFTLLLGNADIAPSRPYGGGDRREAPLSVTNGVHEVKQ